jgi:hypothetical protein
MWVAFGLSTSLVLLVLYLLGVRDERKVRRVWGVVLSRRSEDVYESLHRRFASEIALATSTYERALEIRDQGRLDEAKRLLDAANAVIEALMPDLRKLLAALGSYSRLVSAIVPVAPLRPQDFRLAQLANLAYLGRLLRHLLVTSTDRFRLHVSILGRSFGLATRCLLQATRRIRGNEAGAERQWTALADAMQDVRTLTDKSLETVRALLQALERQRDEEDRMPRWEVKPERDPDRDEWLMMMAWITLVALILIALRVVRTLA